MQLLLVAILWLSETNRESSRFSERELAIFHSVLNAFMTPSGRHVCFFFVRQQPHGSAISHEFIARSRCGENSGETSQVKSFKWELFFRLAEADRKCKVGMSRT
jgi:hypothetical protein